MFQFILTGAASIYYGDEAGIDGDHTTVEGCRYPMPWTKDFQSSEVYQLYQKLAHLKAKHKALSVGGMKFLYSEGQVVAIARFSGEEAFVAVISTSEQDEKIRLPLGVLGMNSFSEKVEVFGKELKWNKLDKNNVELEVKAHQSYFVECTFAK